VLQRHDKKNALGSLVPIYILCNTTQWGKFISVNSPPIHVILLPLDSCQSQVSNDIKFIEIRSLYIISSPSHFHLVCNPHDFLTGLGERNLYVSFNSYLFCMVAFRLALITAF
jgi:hypothetical protein